MSGSDFGDSLFLSFFLRLPRFKPDGMLPLFSPKGVAGLFFITATHKNTASAPSEGTPTAKKVIRERERESHSVSHNDQTERGGYTRQCGLPVVETRQCNRHSYMFASAQTLLERRE